MAFEARRVPPDWRHPLDAGGRPLPLRDGAELARAIAAWDEGSRQWQRGMRTDAEGGSKAIPLPAVAGPYEDEQGPRPDPASGMPLWPAAVATHWMMYENTTEGTPVSPACASPEALARWLTRNQVQPLPDRSATYGAWLAVANGAYTFSFVTGVALDVVDGVTAAGRLA